MYGRTLLAASCLLCAVYCEGHLMVFNESQCVFTYGIAVLNGLTVGSDPSLAQHSRLQHGHTSSQLDQSMHLSIGASDGE